jgi:hypothetical protein
MPRPSGVLIAILRFDGDEVEWMHADVPDHEIVAWANYHFAESGGREPRKWDVVFGWTTSVAIDAIAQYRSDDIPQHSGSDGFSDDDPEDVAVRAREDEIADTLYALLQITADGINNPVE